jgi:hypothetical protein
MPSTACGAVAFCTRCTSMLHAAWLMMRGSHGTNSMLCHNTITQNIHTQMFSLHIAHPGSLQVWVCTLPLQQRRRRHRRRQRHGLSLHVCSRFAYIRASNLLEFPLLPHTHAIMPAWQTSLMLSCMLLFVECGHASPDDIQVGHRDPEVRRAARTRTWGMG